MRLWVKLITTNIILILAALGVVGIIGLAIPEKTRSYKQGFEAGKNWVPASMARADSLLQDTTSVKPDSVEILIKNIYGKELVRVFKVTGVIREE